MVGHQPRALDADVAMIEEDFAAGLGGHQSRIIVMAAINAANSPDLPKMTKGTQINNEIAAVSRYNRRERVRGIDDV